MKLWMRVYLLVVPLVVIVLLGCGAWMLKTVFNETVDREYTRGLSDHAMLIGALNSHLESVQSQFEANATLMKSAISAAIRNYARYYTGADVALQISDGADGTLYSGIDDAAMDAVGLSPPVNGDRQAVIRQVGERTLLFVAGNLNFSGQTYRVDLMRDISSVTAGVRAFAWQMALWQLGAAIFLMLGLYLVIRAALRPIHRLTGEARSLAAGDYSIRIEPGQGEVGQLAGALNELAVAVSGRIDQLQRAAQDRDLFIMNMAHEMKTPMTTILGYSDLLNRANMTQAQRAQALEAIGQEGKRLDALSRKLMDLFRLRDADTLAVREERIPLLFERVRQSLSFQLQQRELTLTVRCDIETFLLDPELFHALLLNLVENAAKASRPGGEIVLSAFRVADSVVFEVLDHGCGIAEPDLQRVLQPFYMADKARARAQNGAGLGLTLAETIAGAHGARLEITSKLGEGTRVRIVFSEPSDQL